VKTPSTWQPFFPKDVGIRMRRRPWWLAHYDEQLRYAAAAVLIGAALWLAVVNSRSAPPQPPQPAQARAAESTSAPPTRHPYKLVVIPNPTPVFATCDGLQLSLPIRPEQITLIAFHQAAGGNDSLHMLTPSGPPARSAAPSSSTGTATPDESAEIAYAEDIQLPGVYGGRVLRLYRSGRDGPPDTAADVGSAQGAQVLAPVTGTVLGVRHYALYGEYDDIEIHISPKDRPDIDVVALHTRDPSVKAGDEVTAGVTPLSKVRWLSKLFDNQLGEYTSDGGNHVHIQVNRLSVPGRMPGPGGATTNPMSDR
jgi:biotin carboxyl carrier protein